MEMAHLVATRATCDRAHVGCIIVRERIILATGYNGSLPGEVHCDDVGHLMIEGHCCRTNHAEANAISHAARNGISLSNSVAYVTHAPCYTCYKLLRSAGIDKIYYDIAYRDPDVSLYGKWVEKL